MQAGELISRQLKAQGVTAKDVSRDCGFTGTFLGTLIKGHAAPKAGTAHRLFEVIDMPLEDRLACVREWRRLDEWDRVADGTWRPSSMSSVGGNEPVAGY